MNEEPGLLASNTAVLHLFFRRGGLCFLITMALLVIFSDRSALAQCPPGWFAGEGIPGVDGSVYATALWDPDGPGPRSTALVIAGQFRLVGSVPVIGVAMWDGTSWSALGTPPVYSATVYAMTVLPNGDLVVAGRIFRTAGSAPNAILRWNGSDWSEVGSGMNASSFVYALAALANGDIVAGGTFTAAGEVSVDRIARWNGSAWSALGTGMDAEVRALLAVSNGVGGTDLIAGGKFTTAGGVPARSVGRWNGTSWSAVGTQESGGWVYSLLSLPNGDLVVGGDFFFIGGVRTNHIARWNGVAWSALGNGVSSGGGSPVVYALAVASGGDVVAGGSFTSVGANLARWNGTTWSALGTGVLGAVYALAALPGDLGAGGLVAGGTFLTAGNGAAWRLARWDGFEWSPMATGVDQGVNSLAVLAGGRLAAGGAFTAAGASLAKRTAIWSGSEWLALGTGMNGVTNAVAALPNGDLIAGGAFTSAGGVQAYHIARWNGSAWSPLGAGTNDFVNAIAVLANGDVVTGGNSGHVTKWNGSSWSTIGTGTLLGPGTATINSLVQLPGGDLIAGGFFDVIGGASTHCIARWNGSTWSPLGAGLSHRVHALAVMPNGELAAGGFFLLSGGMTVNGIARWNGSAWSPFGTGMDSTVRALVLGPGGDLLAGGDFVVAGGVPASRIARWNGSVWSGLGSGLNGSAYSLAMMSNGDLAVGGGFGSAGGLMSYGFARYTFGAPAPSVLMQPLSLVACVSSTASFELSVADPEGVTYQWQHETTTGSDAWMNLVDGTTAGFGIVSGASAAAISIDGLDADAWGRFRCLVSNTCGSVSSDAAMLSICAADFNCDSAVNHFDYNEFVVAFETGTPSADFNRDGTIDFFDYDEFVVTFEMGC